MRGVGQKLKVQSKIGYCRGWGIYHDKEGNFKINQHQVSAVNSQHSTINWSLKDSLDFEWLYCDFSPGKHDWSKLYISVGFRIIATGDRTKQRSQNLHRVDNNTNSLHLQIEKQNKQNNNYFPCSTFKVNLLLLAYNNECNVRGSRNISFCCWCAMVCLVRTTFACTIRA